VSTSNAPQPNTENLSLAEAASAYAARGWRVLPLHDKDKVPRFMQWPEKASCDADTVAAWWRKWPNANIGLACGGSGPVVVDLDGPVAIATLAALTDGPLGPLPDTLTVTTGRTDGGSHRYFTLPPGVELKGTKLGDKLDFLASGKQAVLPPSVHPTGAVYQWNADWQTTPLAELPAAWCEQLGNSKPPTKAAVVQLPARQSGGHTKYGATALDNELRDLNKAPEGSRNHQLNRAAFAVGQLAAGGELDESTAAADLEAAAQAIGLPASEVKATVQSGLAAGRVEPRSAPNTGSNKVQNLSRTRPTQAATDGASDYPAATDVGNAQRLVDRHKDNLRYCRALGGWHYWDSRKWCEDELNQAQELAVDTVKGIHAEAATALDSDDRKQLSRHAIASESRNKLDALLAVASSRPEFARSPQDFDSQPYLLTVGNGTLDLETGKLRKPDRNDHCTQGLDTNYKPEAKAPQWEAFLERVLPDAEVRAFVQRAAGWSLTGDTSPQQFLLLHGSGANGKSVLLSTLSWLLQDYAANTPSQTLMAQRFSGGATDDLARLRAVRMVTASETGDGDRLDTARVKALTSSEPVTARHLYGKHFEFVPRFSLWLATNHLPTVKEQDYGLWRRVALVQFPVTIEPADQDRYLERKLRDEAEGILAWCVRGWQDFQKRGGLAAPPAVELQVEAYRESQDRLAPFLEACVVESPDARCTKKELYGAYCQWWDNEGEVGKPLSSNRLSRELHARGWQDDKATGGTRIWLGYSLQRSLLEQ